METSAADFFHDFRQEMLAGAEASSSFQLASFMEAVAAELIETGFVEGFEFCHFRAQRGMRVDGYWFNDEGALDLFVADFDCRSELATLTRTDVDAAFKRVAASAEYCPTRRDVSERFSFRAQHLEHVSVYRDSAGRRSLTLSESTAKGMWWPNVKARPPRAGPMAA